MRKKTIPLLIILWMFSQASFAADQRAYRPANFAVALDVGTTGVGGSLWYAATSNVTLTLGIGELNTEKDYSTGGVDYTGDFDLSGTYGLLRWRPNGGNFHLSTGAVKTDHYTFLEGRPAAGSSFEIDGVVYPTSALESVSGTLEWDRSTVPYFGLGWATQSRERGWGSFLDLGVIQSGSAQVHLTASGEVADEPVFLERLANEETQLNEAIEEYDLYPVARFGLMFRF